MVLVMVLVMVVLEAVVTNGETYTGVGEVKRLADMVIK